MAEAGPSTAAVVTRNGAGKSGLHDANERGPVGFHFDDESIHVDERERSRLVEQMVARLGKAQGYDGIEASAMDYIVNSVEDVMEALLIHSQELAMVARRRIPSARDGFAALQHAGPRIQPKALLHYTKSRTADPTDVIPLNAKRKRYLDEWLAPSDKWLPSDGEEEDDDEQGMQQDGAERTLSRRGKRTLFRPKMEEVPSHLPSLPPKHTWLFTPSFPKRSEDASDPLGYIDIKTSSTRLTESSLRKLIKHTDNAAFQSREGRKNPNENMEITSISPRTSLPPGPPRASSPITSKKQIATSSTEEDDARRTRKNRPLSLRLRTPSANISSSTSSADVSLEAEPTKAQPTKRGTMPLLGPHRSSLSAAITNAPRSATPLASPALASLRRSTLGGAAVGFGPWTSAAAQSYFGVWGPRTPGLTPTGDVMMTGLATPLTPGGFTYPPTPIDLYANGDMGGTKIEGVGLDQGADGEGEVTLPGPVNFKRALYHKPHTTISHKKEDGVSAP